MASTEGNDHGINLDPDVEGSVTMWAIPDVSDRRRLRATDAPAAARAVDSAGVAADAIDLGDYDGERRIRPIYSFW